jgi:hypothetical protein
VTPAKASPVPPNAAAGGRAWRPSATGTSEFDDHRRRIGAVESGSLTHNPIEVRLPWIKADGRHVAGTVVQLAAVDIARTCRS